MAELKVDKLEAREGAPFAALSYVLFLWIFAFIYKKNNRFAMYHARQGIVIFVTSMICYLFKSVPLVGILSSFILFLLGLACVYGMYLSLSGKIGKIYLISDVAKKLVV